jgi:hypothetical protein
MITSGSFLAPNSFSKNLVSDQTWYNIHSVDSGQDFDAAKGLGIGTNSTSIVVFGIGNRNNVRVTAVVRYDSTTSQAALDMGLLIRCLTTTGTDDTYYYVRLDGSFCKITRVVDNAFVTIASAAFELAHSTDCTITVECVDNQLTVNFDDGSTPADLSVSDNNITGGCFGFRTLSSTGWLKSILYEEL